MKKIIQLKSHLDVYSAPVWRGEATSSWKKHQHHMSTGIMPIFLTKGKIDLYVYIPHGQSYSNFYVKPVIWVGLEPVPTLTAFGWMAVATIIYHSQLHDHVPRFSTLRWLSIPSSLCTGPWWAFHPLKKKRMSSPEIGINFSSHFWQNQCQLVDFFCK